MYVEGLGYNLFSLAQLNKSMKVTVEQKSMTLWSDNKKLFSMKKGVSNSNLKLFGFKFTRLHKVVLIGTLNKQVKFKKFHKMIGHPLASITANMAKLYNYKLCKNEEKCKSCILGKAKQKNVQKFSANKAKIKGERIFMVLSFYSEN